MNSSAISFYPTDLRPVLALAVLCLVALAPVQSHAAYGDEPGSSSLLAAAAEVPFVATADSLNLIADHVVEINSALVDVLASYVGLFTYDYAPQAAAVTAPAGESLLMTLAYVPESLYETVGDTTDFMAAVEMAPVYVITDALSQALFEAGLY